MGCTDPPPSSVHPISVLSCSEASYLCHFKLTCDIPMARNQTGHRFNLCRRPRVRRFDRCQRCQTQGHSEWQCDSVWRQYRWTTDEASVMDMAIAAKALNTVNTSIYCYNCGVEGHLGHECKERRPDEYYIPSSPFVSKPGLGAGGASSISRSSSASSASSASSTRNRSNSGGVHSSSSSSNGSGFLGDGSRPTYMRPPARSPAGDGSAGYGGLRSPGGGWSASPAGSHVADRYNQGGYPQQWSADNILSRSGGGNRYPQHAYQQQQQQHYQQPQQQQPVRTYAGGVQRMAQRMYAAEAAYGNSNYTSPQQEPDHKRRRTTHPGGFQRR